MKYLLFTSATFAGILCALQVSAATITVTSFEDNLPGQKPTGCTLRDAIEAANTDQRHGQCSAGNGEDEIDFPSGTGGVVSVISPLPTITEPLHIIGSRNRRDDDIRISINGGGQTNLFTVHAAPFSMNHLVLSGGSAQGTNPGTGGAISLTTGSGGISFRRVRFVENNAQVSGGAVWASSNSDIVFEECEFKHNAAVADSRAGGGAIFMNPIGAPGNAPTISIIRSTFEGNLAVRTLGDKFQAEPSGGAILFKHLGTVYYHLSIDTSTFWGNEADLNGGAITIDRTSAQSGSAPRIQISNSTFLRNKADRNSDSFGEGGALHSDYVLELKNNVIADNSANQGSINPDIFDTIISRGFNMFGAGNTGLAIAATDLTGPFNPQIDAQFNGLADNGGFTKTVMPVVGTFYGVAIDKGHCKDPDQRLELRPFDLNPVSQAAGGNACDIGSVEFRQ